MYLPLEAALTTALLANRGAHCTAGTPQAPSRHPIPEPLPEENTPHCVLSTNVACLRGRRALHRKRGVPQQPSYQATDRHTELPTDIPSYRPTEPKHRSGRSTPERYPHKKHVHR